ncbi:MAG: hypothetical protein Q7L07_14335 [Pseudohongiella sp.]|nr:hypothetical protein [Pseudohongiella sp.]
MQFGFQRLVLLGSAGYLRGELPLDDSVSLIAPNNTGKTSLINALQFLLIIDQRRMDFGAHEFEKTRRFYFPNNSAFILLEVSLPQSGTVVLGCVGKGVGHDYEYFAYQGPLVVEDYRLPDGRLVSQPQLIDHLARHQRLVYRYGPAEFAELVYGGRRQRTQGEPDFTVFKLENPSDAKAFRQVLTRTLRLDKLNSRDVKTYLLQIFKRDLPDANIDFKQEWDKAFAEVNADRAQYNAAKKQQRRISDLEDLYEQRRTVRGKLLDWRPRIDRGLLDWHAYYIERSAYFSQLDQDLREQESQQTLRDRELIESRLTQRQRLAFLQNEVNEQRELAERFTLITGRNMLVQQAAAIEHALEAQIALVNQAGSRSMLSIQNEQQRNLKELDILERNLANLDENLYLTLGKLLSDSELQRLNRVLSRDVLTLGHDQFELDLPALRLVLAEGTDQQIRLSGLTLNLNQLSAQHQQYSREELQRQLDDLRQRQDALSEQAAVADAMDSALAKKRLLEHERDVIRAELVSFDRLTQLDANAIERDEEIHRLTQLLNEIDVQLNESAARAEYLRQELLGVQQQQSRLDDKNRQIIRMREARSDESESFSYLADLDHYPWVGESPWSLEDLAEKLSEYQQNCRRLLELDRLLNTGLAELHTGGLTKFQFSDNRDTELQRIIAFSHQLDKEFEALEKKARSAVVNVTASLRELRDGLHAFKGKMREFNRLIGHRQLSDLKTFKIEPADESLLVEAIETLIDTASRVSSGESFELFNHGSLLDDADLDRAKQRLIDEGNARHGLKVADLFRLVFIVGKVDQEAEQFDDIDSAASNGTVLMAKLVTGLAMLYLMQDKRHRVRTLCYLDEALALDAHNQRSLIDAASEFGFALIFASPAPLTTARYCVPIVSRNGKNHISRQSWQVLESLEENS